MSSPEEREEKVTEEEEEILLKRLDETTLEDLRTLNSVLFPVRYAVRGSNYTNCFEMVVSNRVQRADCFLSLSLSLSALAWWAHR